MHWEYAQILDDTDPFTKQLNRLERIFAHYTSKVDQAGLAVIATYGRKAFPGPIPYLVTPQALLIGNQGFLGMKTFLLAFSEIRSWEIVEEDPLFSFRAVGIRGQLEVLFEQDKSLMIFKERLKT